MSNAIIMNLTAIAVIAVVAVIAVIAAGWTAAVAVFYTRLNDTPTQPRATRDHEIIELPGTSTRPQPVLAGERAA